MSKLYLFTTTTCPKCPDAKRLVSHLGIKCEIIVADESDSNMKLASRFGITSVPMFIEEFENKEFTKHSSMNVMKLKDTWKK